jgi:hypothetical protein
MPQPAESLSNSLREDRTLPDLRNLPDLSGCSMSMVEVVAEGKVVEARHKQH